MNSPREPEMRNESGDLTTEQIANTGARGQGTDEPRAFEDRREAAHHLFSETETAELRSSWDAIQAGFVDEPRRAVQDADHLVAATIKRLAETFAEERGRLESQWDRGGDVSTEDLRVALQRYRAFFGRLLEV